MPGVPTLETERLLIRELTLDDSDSIHQIIDLDVELETQARDERHEWLQWTVMSYAELAKLYQPPYGERAVVLKPFDQLIGAVGFVPCLMPFGLLPYYQSLTNSPGDVREVPEVGLYYAFAPAFQRQGYATEATMAMIEYAFKQMNLRRIVATTSYDNERSMGVMRRVGMTIEKNPNPGHPPYLQVVGILENSGSLRLP